MRGTANTIDSLFALCEQVTESGCWIFMGPVTDEGYARVSMNWKLVKVHRVFYEHFIGPIQEGLVPDHLCRVRCCVNPWHLDIVTQAVNLLRGTSLQAINALKTHCIRGHALVADNLYVTRDGKHRQCRICHRLRDQNRAMLRRLALEPARLL